MTLIAEHAWSNDAQGAFQWTNVSDGIPQALQEALEPLSGYPWLEHGSDPPIIWAMRVVEAGGVPWHVLTSGRHGGTLPDGRPLRHVRHVVLDQASPTIGPGRHLALDTAGIGVGDDTSMINADARTAVDWSHCGGDWNTALAKRIEAGQTVRLILPATASAMDWWLAIESSIKSNLWQRTILLELLPGEAGADVVLAVDGTPCADALRDSGRAVLDLARSPAPPPADDVEVETNAIDVVQTPGPIPDVAMMPGGPPVGLAALASLALILIAGVIAAVMWAFKTGSVP